MAEVIEWRDGMVRATRDLTSGIRLIEIEPSGGFIAASPGSHINVSVMVRGRPDVRSYSVVGPCADGVYRIAVKLLANTRGGSAYMWSLRPGGRIGLSAPANHFNLALGRPEYLLLAGGIGVTPIFTHALALAEANARFRLLYACRSRDDLALAGELAERLGDRLELFLSEKGRRVDIAAEIARLDGQGEFYVCGPIGMLEAAKRCWRESGRPADRLRFETFGNSGAYPSGPFVIEDSAAWQGNRSRREPEHARSARGHECRHDFRLPARRMRPLRADDSGCGWRGRSSRCLFQRCGEGAEREALHLRVESLWQIHNRRHGGPMKREWRSRGLEPHPETSVAI